MREAGPALCETWRGNRNPHLVQTVIILIATLGEKRGITCFRGWCGRAPPPRALPAEAPTARAASSVLRALLEVCSAEAWDSSAWGTVAERRVIAEAARPLDAQLGSRDKEHWKLHDYLALRVKEESWSKGGEKSRKPSREGAGPRWERELGGTETTYLPSRPKALRP